MSSTVQNASGSDLSRYFFTGSSEYPDIESVFIKDASGDVQIKNVSFANDSGHNPLCFWVAIDRIQVAAGVIFKELKEKTLFNEDSQTTNALKTLGRSLIQLVPLLGNLVLIVYDQIKKSCFINPAVKSNLAEIQGPVIGIAFDGKPIFTVPVAVANASFSSSPDDIFGVFHYMWIKLKQKQFEKFEQNQGFSTLNIAHRLERNLNIPYAQRTSN